MNKQTMEEKNKQLIEENKKLKEKLKMCITKTNESLINEYNLMQQFKLVNTLIYLME